MIHPTIKIIVDKLKSGDYTYKSEYQSKLAIVKVGFLVYTVERLCAIDYVKLYANTFETGAVEIPLTADEYKLLEVHARGDIQDSSPRKYLEIV